MKKKIEEGKTSKNGEQGQGGSGAAGEEQKERENELQHHLELITNIA